MKFGIIGSNFVVDEFLKAAKLVDDFEFTSMYSRDIKKSKEFGGKYGAKYFYDDIEEFLNSDIEAVYIASPNYMHEEHSIKALGHGHNVLCEKIATTSTDSLNRILNKAKEKNKLFMEAMVPTCTPTFLEIKKRIRDIGKIRRVVLQFNQYSSRYDKYKEGIIENAFKPEMGNGALTDIGIYNIEFLVNLFGKPKSIIGNNYKLSTGAIGYGSSILNYGDFESIIMYSKIFNSYSCSEIIGEEGSILIDKISLPTSFNINFRDGNTEKYQDKNINPLMYYEILEFISCAKAGKIESELNPHINTKISVEIVEYLLNKDI